MENEKSNADSVGKRGVACKEENSINSTVIKEVFQPRSVEKKTQELTTRGDEIIKVYKEMNMTDGQEVISSSSGMEEHIHHCHNRIMEFDQELKQREFVVALLGDALSGIIKMLRTVQMQGESVNEDVSILMTRVHCASKLLQLMGLEDEKVDRISSVEQDHIVSDEKESPAIIKVLTQNCANHDSRLISTVMGQCGQHCVHSEELTLIVEMVHMAFDMLQLSMDISSQSRDVNTAGKIEYLVLNAVNCKQEAKESGAQLELLKKENQAIHSVLLNKEEEMKIMKDAMEELQSELNEMKSNSKKVDNAKEKENGSLKSYLNEKEITKPSAVMAHDKCTHSFIGMKTKDALLEIVPNESPPAVDYSLTDNLSESSRLKTEHHRIFINDEINENINCPKANISKEEEHEISIMSLQTDLQENFNSGVSINMHGCRNILEISDILNETEKIENKTNISEFKSDVPLNICATLGILGNRQKVSTSEENDKKEFIKSLVDGENIDEILLNLGSKARELLLVKKQLKIMEEKERKLRSQLNSAIDSCKIAEKRYQHVQNLAINLQNDLECMPRKLRTCKINKTSLDEESSEKTVSTSEVSSSSQVNGENWYSSLDLVEGFSIVGEEYLSTFLANFWMKIVKSLNISEDKTESFASKKMASLKASLESDIREMSLYLKRKCEMLNQLKLSLVDELRFHNLQVEIQKELSRHEDLWSILPEGMRLDDSNENYFSNGILRGDDCSLSGLLRILNSLCMEMDCINSKVMKCLKYCMEQNFEKQSAELKIGHASDVTLVRQLHAGQLNSLKEEFGKKMTRFQEKIDKALENLVLGTKTDCTEMLYMQKNHKMELEAMWNKLDEEQIEVYDCLKERFERIAVEQISLATELYKENYDFKTKQEMNLLKLIHEQEMEVMKSAMEHDKLKELLSFRQEINKSHKENLNEIIQAVDQEMKELRNRCQELALKTSLANRTSLDELKKSIISDCQLILRELSGIWLKKFQDEVVALEEVLNTKTKEKELPKSILPSDSCMGENTTCHAEVQGPLVELRELLLSKSEVHFRNVVQCQLSGIQELMENLQIEYNRFKDKLSGLQANRCHNVPALQMEDKLLESKSEYCSLPQNICLFMGVEEGHWMNEMQSLRKDLEAKHAREMESLRLYFEKKYAEVEKRYSEEVLTRGKKKSFYNCRSDNSCGTSLSGSDAELDSDQFFLSHDDMAVPRNVTGDDRGDLDVHLDEHEIASVAKISSYCNEPQLPSTEKFIESRSEMMDEILKQHKKDLIAFNELHTKELNALQDSDITFEMEELKSEIDKMKMRHNQALLIAKLIMRAGIDEATQRLIQEFTKHIYDVKQHMKNSHKEDLYCLKEEINRKLDQSQNVLLSRYGESDVELDDAITVTNLRTDLDELLKDRDKWKVVSQTTKNVLMNVLEYTHNCEEELNCTIVQSILRLSGISEKSSLSNDNSIGEEMPRRVHFAPDVLTEIFEPDESEVVENFKSRLEESCKEIRLKLKDCLGRLRAEASALLGISTSLKHSEEKFAFNGNLSHYEQELINKISLLENHLKVETMEKDRLKVELHTMKGLCEGYSAAEVTLLARASQAEAQLSALLMKKADAQRGIETVSEGFGEGNGTSNFDRQLQKLAQLREKARSVLKQHSCQGKNCLPESDKQTSFSSHPVVQLVEELCNECDRLSEEARREREDLQLQVEVADKQLRCTRAFLEEQAVEREQEREEFQREISHLHEVLGGRERDKGDKERMAREVEVLEQQSKDLTQALKGTMDRKVELETELKVAIDKIWDLREIIRELEGQAEGSLLLERELREKNKILTTEITLQSKKLNDLIEELESLQSSLGYNVPGEMEDESHTALLEKALRNHCLQVEQAKAMGPSLKDMKMQLLEMGASIDRKTKELEALHVTPLTCGNCNSPSEDVSIREQLDQATWRSESPMEDEVADRELADESDSSGVEGRGKTTFQLPRVPLVELRNLQGRFIRHFQAEEPLLKRIHDLEMQIQALKQNEEDLMTEREVLQSQVEEQLLQASELQARLDEARRRGGGHIHCMTATPLPSSPLSRSPIGPPSTKLDQPSFCCAGLADARHEVENLTEYLEKRELEVTQLKRALENSKKVVASQEKELMNKVKEEAETLEKLKELERLKSEKDMLQMKYSNKIQKDAGTVSFSVLLDSLLEEKNEQIDFLELQLASLREQLSKVSVREEVKTLSNNLVYVPEISQIIENKQAADIPENNDSGHQEDVEVLRDCVVFEESLDKRVLHQEQTQGYNQAWFNSTKIDTENLSNLSPGLGISPLTSCGKAHVVINDPVLEKESLEETPYSTLSDMKDSSKGDGEGDKEELDDAKEGEGHSKVRNVAVQSDEQNEMEDLRKKDEEIESLKIKVDVLLREKNSLSQLVVELREKTDWHSRHLEMFEKESRDAMMSEFQTEKKEILAALEKSEQEMAKWKTSHGGLQERIMKQEEQINMMSEKIEKYSKANKEQHMLLKVAQEERKEIISELRSLRPTSSENWSTSDGKDEENNQGKLSSSKTVLKDMVTQLVNEVKSFRIEMSNLTNERNQLKKEIVKAVEYQTLESFKGSVEDAVGCRRNRIWNENGSNETLGPISIQGERGSSPSLISLEQMMQKVQQEGIEVLSLSEIAAGKRSTPGGTPSLVTSPFGSPKSMQNTYTFTERDCSSIELLKNRQDVCKDNERVQLLMRVQALENELSSKEREEMRKRDWLEFQEKEGQACWTDVVEAVGQKQRHELSILEKLGEQRNARVRLEAERDQLNQQLTQAEAEMRKVTYRLGMERSNVIRLESALQQEKSNFSQLQVSLDTERRRANMTKQLNFKINKALQSEVIQFQSRVSHLQKSLKQEHELRMKLEVRLKQIQMEQCYAAETSETRMLQLEVIADEECRQLKKIEEDCERKALEEELEDEKQKRIECQQEVMQLRSLLETRNNQEIYEPAESIRWSNATFPATSCTNDSSFNAEDMLQNLKGVNQVLGWHIRQRDDCHNPDFASIEAEKHYLEAKCCHLEQKLENIQEVLDQERALWTNERLLLLEDRQNFLEANGGSLQHNVPKEFQVLVQQLYSLYWRSERNRKALAWQKRYFLSVLGNFRNFKVDMITELSKTSDEQRFTVDKIMGLGRIKYSKENAVSKQLLQQKPRDRKSFRVFVWTVIAILKMKMLVLRSSTGIRVGCQSLLKNILPTSCSHTKANISLYRHQTH